MTTEGWPDDRLTSADAPTVVRYHAGPLEDPDRYELLGEAEGADEAWHVLDHRAEAGEGLFTLAALRPAAPVVDDLQVVHDDAGAPEAVEPPVSPEQVWRERAAGLARVRHARLAGVVDTFAGSAPHAPGQSDADTATWSYAVLEQAAGRSVADWLRDDPGAAVEERFTVLATAAGVLQELHRGSEDAPPLVHGDITPRTVRLGGFWPADGVRLAGASLGGLRSGPVAGNVSSPYTAPEVREGALPSAASDVFGFGATAVLVLTGQPPAQDPDGGVDPALVRRQLAAAPLTAAHPGLADLLLQALAEDPRERPDRLPGWVNAMRAYVEPRPTLDPYDGYEQGAETVAPVAAPGALARARSLPHRPVVVVVGALILATAGTAVAIAAVQAGRLADVPNPVAIVQPPPVEQTAVPTSAPEVNAAPPSTTQESSAAGGSGDRTGSGVRTSSGGSLASQLPTSVAGVDPSSVPPLDSGLPTTVVPPLGTSPEVPTTTLIPPVVGPTVEPITPTIPPTLIPPVVTTAPTTPPTTPPTTTPPTTPPTTAPTVTVPPVVPTVTVPPSSEPPAPEPTTPEPTTPDPSGTPTTSSAPAETGTATVTGSPTDAPTDPPTDSAEPTATELP